MIKGIGIDTVEISRIQRFLDDDNQALLNRLFTDHEQQYCRRRKQAAACLAARFAAKEALVKALGTGLRDGLSWVEMEVVNDTLGKPELNIFGRTQELIAKQGTLAIHLSLSHDGDNAVAFVVLEAP